MEKEEEWMAGAGWGSRSRARRPVSVAGCLVLSCLARESRRQQACDLCCGSHRDGILSRGSSECGWCTCVCARERRIVSTTQVRASERATTSPSGRERELSPLCLSSIQLPP